MKSNLGQTGWLVVFLAAASCGTLAAYEDTVPQRSPIRVLDDTIAAAKSPGEKADKLVDAFLKAPAVEGPPVSESPWEATTKRAFSDKNRYVVLLVEMDDPAAFKRLWKKFPELTEDEQDMFTDALVDKKGAHLDQVPAVLAAVPQAKSEYVAKALHSRANVIVLFALDVPEKADAAAKLAERMKAEKTADEDLLKKMASRAEKK